MTAVNKQAVAGAFGRAAATYDRFAELQRLSGQRLKLATGQGSGGTAIVQMGGTNALKRTHGAERIGKMQPDRLAEPAHAGRLSRTRNLSGGQKAVGVTLSIHRLPRLMQLRQRAVAQGAEQHPTSGTGHPFQLRQAAGEGAAPLHCQAAPRKFDAISRQR